MCWLKRWALIFTVLLSLVVVATAVAQETSSLQLRLNRDFGTGLGSNIQGRFSFRVEGPDNLETVSFYIDDQLVGEDSEAPFRLQFETDRYALGTHTLYAIGQTADGQTIESNRLTRNFISGGDSTRIALYIIIPIIVIAIGGRFLASRISNRGRKSGEQESLNVHGPVGGTICPKCNKPFARHIWGLNVVVGKYDRCPHCGKWSLVRALPADQLDAAVEAMEAEAAQDKSQSTHEDDDESWRKRLDDSKFDS
ncbi:Ig-like domain-containing protein [Candidatus Leptofilum sp.]|uniref:Ig-like domain-containing protein n=1 Tax=Candidatus Leptofilum sp. TaxID=3241576 RepID=UPI003B5B328F